MQEEFDALMRMEAFDFVPRPAGVQVVRSRWVFKSKLDSEGNVARRKARFVAKGFTQRVGEHYDQTFSPVVSGAALRAVLGLCAQRGWHVRQLDVGNAFINALIDGLVYVEAPEGFGRMGPDGRPMVLLLRRGLYGLAQSPRLWCKEVSEVLAQLGFVASPVDPCVFVHVSTGVILLLYVDDLLITGSEQEELLTAAVKQLESRFTVRDLGTVRWFLGMNIKVLPGRVELNQDAYVRILLERFGMADCNGTDVPAVPGGDGGNAGSLLDAPAARRYRSLVGGLLYIAVQTRPDIAFVVMQLARHMAAPAEAHWRGARKVLRYLKGHPGGLSYTAQPGGDAQLVAFADASFATDTATGKSTTGFVLLFCGAAVAWRSKLQSTVAQSTTEAEYIAAALAAAEVYWMRQLLAFLGCPQMAPTPIFEDNSAALQLAANPVVQQRTRTINVKYHYIRQLVGQREVDVVAVRTHSQRADILTKALPRGKFAGHARALLGA
jgi:hypothetical protein